MLSMHGVNSHLHPHLDSETAADSFNTWWKMDPLGVYVTFLLFYPLSVISTTLNVATL